MRRGQAEAGFAMTDAIIGLLIAGAAGAALVSMQSISLRASEAAEQKLSALFVAETVIAQNNLDTKGVMTIGGTEFKWSAERERPHTQTDYGVAQNTVTVEWAGYLGHQKSLELRRSELVAR